MSVDEQNGQSIDLTETLCIETTPSPCGIVIFGASGDLAERKLLPSLFHLFERNLLADKFFVVGFARTPLGRDGFRQKTREALKDEADDAQAIDAFCERLEYLAGSYSEPAIYEELKRRLDKLTTAHDTGGNIVFYLSTPPKVHSDIASRLSASGLLESGGAPGAWRRLVVEKPFGHDLDSARQLDASLSQYLREDQIYRIDHYLGKETVQNILMMRFANTIFEPVWNRQYVDHVQIAAAEDIGIGHRAGYYEKTGLLRDMFQNHMLQLLALVAIEPPSSFAADHVRDEKLKLLRCIRPFSAQAIRDTVIRAQYAAGSVGGEAVRAYRDEEGVAPDSMTETYVAAKFMIDNWRWHGVPFYMRSGKRLRQRVTEIAVTFKAVPHSIFTPLAPEHLTPNQLILNVQPREGVGLRVQAKRPGPKLCMTGLTLTFDYRNIFGDRQPEAYERLLLDVMLGDQTLFIRRDNVDAEWSILMPILEQWKADDTDGDLLFYDAGAWGPEVADDLLRRDGRAWRSLSDH